MPTRRERVYIDDILAGSVSDTEDGFQFQYDPAYIQRPDARPLSESFPLREEPFYSKILFSFFEGLQPKIWLLENVCSAWGMNTHDKFSLLCIACRDLEDNIRVGDSR